MTVLFGISMVLGSLVGLAISFKITYKLIERKMSRNYNVEQFNKCIGRTES